MMELSQKSIKFLNMEKYDKKFLDWCWDNSNIYEKFKIFAYWPLFNQKKLDHLKNLYDDGLAFFAAIKKL